MGVMTVMKEAGDCVQILSALVGMVDSVDIPNEQKKQAVVEAMLVEAKDLGLKTPPEKLRPIFRGGVELLVWLGKLWGALQKSSGNASLETPGAKPKTS